MTGYGDARRQGERLNVSIEIRSVNSRYFKLSARIPEAYAALEGEIEKVVREVISRGSVSLALRIERAGASQRAVIDRAAIEAYWSQLSAIAAELHTSPAADLSRLLALPGVVTDLEHQPADLEADWPLIRDCVRQALEGLQAFRVQEGKAMEAELRQNGGEIAEQLGQIAAFAPQVVSEYRDKVHQRIRDLLRETDVRIDPADLIREVSIFADRCDINEEITRLRSHLEQFESFFGEATSQGRKLEFLCQEMFREINTIGSKANHVGIAHCAVAMKAAVEKMREIMQNVE